MGFRLMLSLSGAPCTPAALSYAEITKLDLAQRFLELFPVR